MINSDYKERLSCFLRSLEPEGCGLLNDIETDAVAAGIPIARRETVSFLQTMTEIVKPSRILEVGTAVAYSTVYMAMSAGPDCRLVSIERSPKNYDSACENVKKAVTEGLIKEGQIELVFGDAADVLKQPLGEFDMVFMDAAKGQYLSWLPDVLLHLKKGGVLISDNIFQDGTVLESKFSIERRDRTIHKRMRDYLFELKHNENLCTSIINVGDGVALSYRR